MPAPSLVRIAPVRLLYDTDDAVKAVVDALADTCQNKLNKNPSGFYVSETTVGGAVEVTGLGRAEIINALKKLAGGGCGQFLNGRRGQESRLKWRYLDPQEFAQQVVGTNKDVVNDEDAALASAAFTEQQIWIRPNVQVAVRFPQDMTKDEAEKVAGVVRNLWLTQQSETLTEAKG